MTRNYDDYSVTFSFLTFGLISRDSGAYFSAALGSLNGSVAGVPGDRGAFGNQQCGGEVEALTL